MRQNLPLFGSDNKQQFGTLYFDLILLDKKPKISCFRLINKCIALAVDYFDSCKEVGNFYVQNAKTEKLSTLRWPYLE